MACTLRDIYLMPPNRFHLCRLCKFGSIYDYREMWVDLCNKFTIGVFSCNLFNFRRKELLSWNMCIRCVL
jgi:hypothetical protein